jgi:hypothetical protein
VARLPIKPSRSELASSAYALDALCRLESCWLFPNPQAINVVDDVVAQASRAYDLGVRQVWLGQQNDHDAIALAALVGAAVPGLGVGTAVVPINTMPQE